MWKEALKEWNVIESEQVVEWMAMGEAKGEINSLLQVLATLFPLERLPIWRRPFELLRIETICAAGSCSP